MAKIVKKKTKKGCSLSRKALEGMGLWTEDYLVALSATEMRVCHNFIQNGGSQQRALLDVLPVDYELRRDQVSTGVKLFFSRKKISDYISREMRYIEQKLEVTTEKLLAEMASVAFSDVADFLDDDGKINIGKASRLTKKAIKSLKVRRINRSDDIEEDIVELVLHDKIGSLDKLFKNKGLYSADNAQRSVAELSTHELLAEIERLRAET